MRSDVAPPGRESQVQALKKQPNVESPYAVAWSSYNKSQDSYDAAMCPVCKQPVPVMDWNADPQSQQNPNTSSDPAPQVYVPHMTGAGGGYNADAYDYGTMCDGSYGAVKMDVVEKRGGSWVLLAKSTGKVLGTHATKEEAEQQERAVQANKHADSAPRVRRFDMAELAAPQRTNDGFLKVEGRIARTGTQEYRDDQGNVRVELRIPEEVQRSVPQFALQPLTNTHPPELVTPRNAKQYVVGAVGDATMHGDGWVSAPLSVFDGDAIADAQAGRRQLSVGYSCRLDTSPQDPKLVERYGRYDAIQRDIVVNHVALVSVARAGADARIRLDSGDAVSTAIARDTHSTEPSKSGATMAHVLKVDGVSFEVADPNAQVLVDRAVAAAKRDGDDRAAKAERGEKKLQKALDELQAKYDALENAGKKALKIGAAEIAFADFRDDEARREAFLGAAIEQAAQSRASLLAEAQKHLGANENLSGKSTRDIKAMVVSKLSPDAKLDGKSDDYVSAAFDIAVATAAKAPRAADLARTVHDPAALARAPEPGRSDAGDAVAEARRKMIERNQAQLVKRGA